MIPLEVKVQHPTAVALARGADAALAMVEGFEVVDATTYELAAEELTMIKRKATTLDDQRKAITKPMDDAKKAVMDLFRAPLDLLGKAEGILKGKMLTYYQAEQAKAAEARQVAERAAQAERKRLAAEAAELESQGRSGEAAMVEQVAAMVVAAPAVVAEPAKVVGVSMRSTVEFEVVNLLDLVKHVAAHPELVDLLMVDSTKLRNQVRATGMNTILPGVKVFEKSSLAASCK